MGPKYIILTVSMRYTALYRPRLGNALKQTGRCEKLLQYFQTAHGGGFYFCEIKARED